MGLFDRKYCDICGEKIGMIGGALGSRKLADGNLCKTCEGKLSHWFQERKLSTIEDIQEQLRYREANAEEVANFNVTRTLGDGTVICLDENQQKFMICRTNNRAAENPDVLSYEQVTGVNIDIQENKHEMNMNQSQDGPQRTPELYYTYDFYVNINVNHPYFSQIRYKLNRNSIRVDALREEKRMPGIGGGMNMGGQQARPMQPMGGGPQMGGRPGQQMNRPGQSADRPGQMNAMGNRPGQQMNRPGQQMNRPGQPAGGAMQQPRVQYNFTKLDPQTNIDYQEAQQLGAEIKELLMTVRQEGREAAQAYATRAAVNCPACGATTFPDANGRCEYCGSALPL